MKRLFTLLGVILSSFFFSILSVNATTYNYTLTTSKLNIIADNYSDIQTMIETADSLNFTNGYQIYRQCTIINNVFTCRFRVYVAANVWKNPTFRCTTNVFYAASTNIYDFNSDYTTLTYTSANSSNSINIDFYTGNDPDVWVIIYTSIPHPPTTSAYVNDNVYNFTNGDKTYTYSCNDTTTSFPSLLDLYDYYYSPPPIPPDNTPLLTDFVSIVIEKLEGVVEYVSSSYVFLSCFVIFILYFVIYLFRRLT